MRLADYKEFLPKEVPVTLTVPQTTLYDNLQWTAKRFPDKAALYYYGATISYQTLDRQVIALAGYLQNVAGVSPGDRVMLYMQNAPQFVVGLHAILRANAVVVPVNPMNLTAELRFYAQDSGARVAILGQELFPQVEPLIAEGILRHVVVAAYGDYAPPTSPFELPEVVAAPRQSIRHDRVVLWEDALALALKPGEHLAGPDDLAVLPYTSGTTGVAKACMHPHRTVQANIAGGAIWSQVTSESVGLASLPFFHVTGMVHSMFIPIYLGATQVVMTRWNRTVAAELIAETRVTHWVNIATMVVDFLSNPQLSAYDISSLTSVGGGGAALPQAVGERLQQLTGLQYMEGYGLSETISQTHQNPPKRAKLQCMGIPSYGVDARIIHPDTLEELGANQEGEVIVCGPQVFMGYWQRPEENAKAFLERDGMRFFRTGDIARYDDEGYFFMVDRVKRMINAAGFKVWPSEVESILYRHPSVEQACVIGVPDERRGETVKAYIILRSDSRGRVSEDEIIGWCHEQMAAYKCPRMISFVDSLPISATGKILWRKLQEDERIRLRERS